MEKICKNCRLFNEQDGVCAVTVLVNGERYELPVAPSDRCHWEQAEREIAEEMAAEMGRVDARGRAALAAGLDVPIEVRQIRMWSDGHNGYVEMPDES